VKASSHQASSAINFNSCLFDFKCDGFRALCYLEQGRCRSISRNGNLMSPFAGLGEDIAASLDAEITSAIRTDVGAAARHNQAAARK